jgi:hypothetical protein
MPIILSTDIYCTKYLIEMKVILLDNIGLTFISMGIVHSVGIVINFTSAFVHRTA